MLLDKKKMLRDNKIEMLWDKKIQKEKMLWDKENMLWDKENMLWDKE